MNNKKSIWISFIVYVTLFLIICLLVKDKTNKPQLAWLLLQAYSFLISIKLLKNYKFPKKNQLFHALIYTFIYSLSTIQYFELYSLVQIILFFIGVCAVISTINKEKIGEIRFLKNTDLKSIIITIVIGIIVGIIFGGINYLLMMNNNEINNSNLISAFFLSLNPALGEEILYRTVFYVLVISTIKNNKKGKFLCWFMMIVPHVVPHTTDCFNNNFVSSLITWPIYLLLYSLIFGFIFALLQKKRDITSAMIAHGIVDFIRFYIYGIPM